VPATEKPDWKTLVADGTGLNNWGMVNPPEDKYITSITDADLERGVTHRSITLSEFEVYTLAHLIEDNAKFGTKLASRPTPKPGGKLVVGLHYWVFIPRERMQRQEDRERKIDEMVRSRIPQGQKGRELVKRRGKTLRRVEEDNTEEE
jgi:hypothetical protein